MHRPGNINGLGYTPRRQSGFSGFSGLGGYSGYSRLGTFGKSQSKGQTPGLPGPPPAEEVISATYVGGKWVCDGDAPTQTADSYYHCCPGGWSKTGFQITRPCGKDYGQTVCGPIPPGATVDDGVCCENIKEWMPHMPEGGDPCEAAEQALMAQGQVVAGRAESMLAPELVIDQGPLISPTLMMAGGVAVAALFVVTIIIKLKN